jgi:pimeloyl-ACP methyl ester carboxylesterase
MMARSGKSIRYILPILILALLTASFQWLGYLGGDPFSLSRPQGYRPGHGTPIVIILSGDMGMKVGMGPGIMARLTRDGMPTVGVNSLTYFRKTRSPAEATALIGRALAQAHSIDPAAPVILIGQSFGADMAHVGLATLPAAQRHAIAMVALVVPGATVCSTQPCSSSSCSSKPGQAATRASTTRASAAPPFCVRFWTPGISASCSVAPANARAAPAISSAKARRPKPLPTSRSGTTATTRASPRRKSPSRFQIGRFFHIRAPAGKVRRMLRRASIGSSSA